MAETHVMSALLEKRARKLGEIKANRFQAMRLAMELAHIDAVIRMFRPGVDLAAMKPKMTRRKSPAALPKGAGARMAVDILRETGEALTAQELATAALIRAEREVEPETVALLAKAIHSSLSRQQRSVAVYDRATWPGKWRLVPEG
jgi:hypothetical protein